jgi:hypothetical protein
MDRTMIELCLGDGWRVRQIAGLLRLEWSPEQISVRRKPMEGSMAQHSGLLVSHEAI